MVYLFLASSFEVRKEVAVMQATPAPSVYMLLPQMADIELDLLTQDALAHNHSQVNVVK